MILSLQQRFLPIQQLDVSNAFIYAQLPQPVYIQLPKGHPKYTQSNHQVWKTSAAIYGLHESPQLWHSTIDSYLQKYGFKPLISEPCLYLLTQGGKSRRQEAIKFYKSDSASLNSYTKPIGIHMILLLYVDDMLLAGQPKTMKDFKYKIEQDFKVAFTDKAKELI